MLKPVGSHQTDPFVSQNIGLSTGNDSDEMMAMETIRLELLKARLYTYISEELVDDIAISPEVEVSALESFVRDQIAVLIRLKIWSQELDKVSVCYPRDWWQAVKERFASGWFLRRWPVEYDKTVIDVRALYPKLAFPQEDFHCITRVLEKGTAHIDRI